MSDIGQLPLALVWMPVGIALAGLHLWMLRRALYRVEGLEPTKAGNRLATTVPLRLLAVAPALVLAARAGLWACLGVVAGSLAGRWIIVGFMRGGRPFPMCCHRQGQIRGH